MFIVQFRAYLGNKTGLNVVTVAENDFSLVRSYKTIPLLKKSFSRYMDRSLVNKLTELVKKEEYDTLICEHPYFAWLVFAVRKRTGIRVIIQTHNIEYQRFRSMGKWWWPILRRYEKRSFEKADGILFITPEDRYFATNEWKIDPGKCFDCPFGVEIKQYPEDRAACRQVLAKRYDIQPGELILLFNGLLNYKPNLDAVKTILDEVNPLLDSRSAFQYKIIICGKGLPHDLNSLQDYRDKNIIYAGFVDDIETYFKAADIFLNPVQSGGGIKTKMVEAIALGATGIATRTGASGIMNSVCGNKLILVNDNDWEGFANAIMDNFNNTTPTPQAYYDYYSWEKIVQHVLAQLADHPAAQPKYN